MNLSLNDKILETSMWSVKLKGVHLIYSWQNRNHTYVYYNNQELWSIMGLPKIYYKRNIYVIIHFAIWFLLKWLNSRFAISTITLRWFDS